MIEEYKFPTELKLWKYEVERLGLRFGLDLIPVVYTIVEFDEMSEIVALGGFPVDIPHWEHGQNSIYFKKRYKHGLGRIMEIVINTQPVYAYNLKSNSIMTHKSVMAHVNGHVDIYARSRYFKPTNRSMVEVKVDHRILFEKYMVEHGEEKVKQFYDMLLSFRNYIDANALYVRRVPRPRPDAEIEKEKDRRKVLKRIEVPEGLPLSFDEWVNPPEWFAQQKKEKEAEEDKARDIEKGLTIPPVPMLDIYSFLRRYAPLEDWQRGLISMVQEESYHHAPHKRMKGTHEGWAMVVEEEIMSSSGMLFNAEIIPFAEESAAVQRKHRQGLNPYRFFYELFLDIWFRWDTGRHGDIWERCESMEIKEHWDRFVIFKNIFEESAEDESKMRNRWSEFLVFEEALKGGSLGFPKEFFIRNLYTRKYLVLTWLRYQHAELEYAAFMQRLKEMQPYEDEVKIKIPQEAMIDDVSPEVLLNKVRKDVYEKAGRKDLYLWTEDEIKSELKALQFLFDFKERFQRGEYNCLDIPVPEEWLHYARRFPEILELGKGKERVFEVVETYDDLMIIDEFFTQEFCLEKEYFLYKAKPLWDWSQYPAVKQHHFFFENRSFERIKKFLLFQYTNAYTPIIYVVDGNYDKNGELYMKHEHNGLDLDYWSDGGMHIKDVLERIYKIWGRPVHLETIKTKEPEERPWWYRWHETEEKSTDGLDTLEGTRVRYSWGKHGGGFYETILEPVKFTAPF